MREPTRPIPTLPPRPAVLPFPTPGPRVRHAYDELDKALHGTPAELQTLGEIRLLPRPWDPATCLDPELRAELWKWLDDVVTWLNHEYRWDVTGMIPACWPKHPHLIHEIAVLADLRRSAGHALTGDALEEWHRYALPAFTDRMRQRLRSHCDDGHQPWPAHSRHTRHTATDAATSRRHTYRADIATLRVAPPDPEELWPRLTLIDGAGQVNTRTGEITP